MKKIISNNIELFISFIYFFILLPFYIKSYEVPDYFLYNNFAQMHLPAKDGFSSLFILISNLLIEHSFFIQFLMLTFMTISLYLLLKQNKLINSGILKISYMIFIISLGSFWYFYGKIFYEFPFICLLFGIIVNLTIKKIKYLLLTFFLAGFCLSFKPYAIFILFPYFFILIIYKPKLLNFLIKKIPILFPSFLAGYLLGNFNILFDFNKTITGIRAYSSSSDILTHLFYNYKNKLLWDNVINFSFNTGICNIFTSVFILFILPCLIKNKIKIYLLILNVLTAILYLIFIKYFSFGYIWHGFCISLYFISILALTFIYKSKNMNLKIKKIILFVCVIQMINNYIIYLPQEIIKFIKTDIAYKALDKNKEEITKTILKNIGQNDKFGLVYNLQRRDIKTGKYILETAKNFKEVQGQTGNKETNNIIFFTEYENYTRKQKYLPLVYLIPSDNNQDKNIQTERNNFEKDSEIIYNKDNIKVYMKRVGGNEIYSTQS